MVYNDYNDNDKPGNIADIIRYSIGMWEPIPKISLIQVLEV